jgi:putative endonuclease
MVHVYILKSLKDNKYYIGITKNLENRLAKHNRGEVFSTKTRKPFILIKSEEFENYSNAREREKEIKSYKGGNKFKKLIE